MATAPGTWSWRSGSKPADPGLEAVTGSFTAVGWTAAQKAENPTRCGMIRPSANGHAFQYADGTPFLLIGDTWWATPTFRFRWRDDDTLRPTGPEAGFKEFVAYRRKQEFNCVALLAALPNWGHTDKARWLGFHQIGNLRTHDSYALLTEIFKTNPAVPAINGEPYYDGMENIEGGSEEAAAYCRSAMYGSILSGGLGGHIYGVGGWNGGVWSGEVEEASKVPRWKVFQWPSGDQMRHLKTFILSEGRRYQDLTPCADRISPSQSAGPKGISGWAYGAATPEQDLLLLYFERDCPEAAVTGAKANARYAAHWFDPRKGRWAGRFRCRTRRRYVRQDCVAAIPQSDGQIGYGLGAEAHTGRQPVARRTLRQSDARQRLPIDTPDCGLVPSRHAW